MIISSERFQGLFKSFARSAVRMETHPTYTMPAEADTLNMFLTGEDKPVDYNAGWVKTVSDNAAAGKTMQRLKIVRRPFSDYDRYLFAWAIPDNVAAGEDYRIIDVTERELDIPRQDFWIFDESTVALLNFNPDGTLDSRELVESGDVKKYFKWRDLALPEAVPFGEYRT